MGNRLTGNTWVRSRFAVEWPTLAVLALCWSGWGLAVHAAGALGAPVTIVLLSLCLALYSSLQHEVLHGHPTRAAWLNTLFVLAPIGLLVPFCRFRQLHLAHHGNQNLTDPFDDPESYYVAADHWRRYPAWLKLLLRWNNTLAGRVAIGPALGAVGFLLSEMKLAWRGDVVVLRAWAIHFVLLVIVSTGLAAVFTGPWWVYGAGVYGGMGIIYVRTFLEHRAHHDPSARSVIIEDRGLLAFLFLNNNLHAAHHLRPALPWYALPGFYARNRARLLQRNQAYRYRSYGEIFKRYAFRRKEPVVHPFGRPEER